MKKFPSFSNSLNFECSSPSRHRILSSYHQKPFFLNSIFPPSKENPFYTRNDLPIIHNSHLSPPPHLSLHPPLSHSRPSRRPPARHERLDELQLRRRATSHNKTVINVNVGYTKYTNLSCTVWSTPGCTTSKYPPPFPFPRSLLPQRQFLPLYK